MRNQRHSLHEQGLLSDVEYWDLLADGSAVTRLESYDDMRKRLEALEAAQSGAGAA